MEKKRIGRQEFPHALYVMVLYRSLGINVSRTVRNRTFVWCLNCKTILIFPPRSWLVALVVIGGGDSACEEAIFLTKYASKVYVLVRRDKLRASKVMADRLLNHPKVEVLWNKKPIEAKGDGRLLRQVVIGDTITHQQSSLDVNGLFYAIGHKPNTDLFKGILDMDDDGYVKTYPNHGYPSTYTNVAGVFACGDVQDKIYRQVSVKLFLFCV